MLESVRARIRAVDPFHADVLLAALFVVVNLLEFALVDPPDGRDRALTMVAGAVAVSAVAFRRRDPLIAGVIFAVPMVIQAPLDGYLTTEVTTPFVALILLFYSTGRYADDRRFWPAFGVPFVATLVALSLEEEGLTTDVLLWGTIIFVLPALAGRALRSRALLQAELREKTARAEAERVERARSAVEEERARIAAELQAIVANGVSAMVVQAEAVPRAIAVQDNAGAGTAFAAVEVTGRDALTEMRRLLGVLRRDGDGPELAPQPGLARLETLVERVRANGLEVDCQMEGEERTLPPGLDLTAYRVIEDALSAASEQGASEASLVVRYGPRDLDLEVLDDRSGGESERLPGLRDRVGLYGGRLRTGRRESGGFQLTARLPLEGSD